MPVGLKLLVIPLLLLVPAPPLFLLTQDYGSLSLPSIQAMVILFDSQSAPSNATIAVVVDEMEESHRFMHGEDSEHDQMDLAECEEYHESMHDDDFEEHHRSMHGEEHVRSCHGQ